MFKKKEYKSTYTGLSANTLLWSMELLKKGVIQARERERQRVASSQGQKKMRISGKLYLGTVTLPMR